MALTRITGLWRKKGKNGTFWAGKTREEIPAGVGLMIFENNDQESDDDPEYVASYADDSDEDEKPRRSRSTAKSGGRSRRSRRDEE